MEKLNERRYLPAMSSTKCAPGVIGRPQRRDVDNKQKERSREVSALSEIGQTIAFVAHQTYPSELLGPST